MPELPSGEVTFLLTDVEGSTRLWGEYPELAGRALARHDEIMVNVVSAHAGVIPHRGEGDSVLAAFAGAGEAVAAALALQLAFSAERWPGGVRLRVRMGLHTGEAAIRDGDYEGLEVNRATRRSSCSSTGPAPAGANSPSRPRMQRPWPRSVTALTACPSPSSWPPHG